MTPYFVSFYPRIPLEENLSLFDPLVDPGVRDLLKQVAGVLLPPYTPPWRYGEIKGPAREWFPRLDTRFECAGKIAQIRLFRRMGARCPETLVFADCDQLLRYFARFGSPWGYPLVLKGDKGGGGSTVYPIHSPEEIARQVARLPRQEPVLLQKMVDHGGKDLRVVVHGDRAVSYFRVGGGQFYNNVCRGGRIERELWPEQSRIGRQAVLAFSRRAAIDMAGFDLMFADDRSPFFIEINFHFGRKGLGGLSGHQDHLQQAFQRWRQRILNPV